MVLACAGRYPQFHFRKVHNHRTPFFREITWQLSVEPHHPSTMCSFWPHAAAAILLGGSTTLPSPATCLPSAACRADSVPRCQSVSPCSIPVSFLLLQSLYAYSLHKPGNFVQKLSSSFSTADERLHQLLMTFFQSQPLFLLASSPSNSAHSFMYSSHQESSQALSKFVTKVSLTNQCSVFVLTCF